MAADTPGLRFATRTADVGGAWAPAGPRTLLGDPPHVPPSAGPPSERLEVDLGVGLAEIERLDLPGLHELLADGAWMGELDERSGRRVGAGRRAELDMAGLVQHIGVPQSAVTHHETLFA